MSKKIWQIALLDALGAVVYIALVAILMSNAENIFPQGDTWLTGITFLLLLVFSATMMGLLIFGRSITWYLDGRKKEAISLVFYKIVYLLVGLALSISFLIASK